MSSEIKIWAIDGPSDVSSSKVAKELETISSAETEKYLEDLFVDNPDLLMPDITLVARQAPAGIGNLDLLGIDKVGNLVIFELKRGKIAREHVAQIIDYCSDLEAQNQNSLSEYIVANSKGIKNIEPIDDLNEWYSSRGLTLGSGTLKPIRMVLVAFGVDSSAQRMVKFLNENGVTISIQTFHGYKSGDKMLVASRFERGAESSNNRLRPRQDPDELSLALDSRAEDSGIDFWKDIVDSLDFSNSRHFRQKGITYYQRAIKLPGKANSYGGSHSVVIEGRGRVRVIFFPAAIHLCRDFFESNSVSFKDAPASAAPPTSDFQKQKFCVLDKKNWEKHKEALSEVSQKVYDAWEKHRDSGADL